MKRRLTICFLVILVAITLSITQICAKTSNVYYKFESGNKKIALTFDDGPHPRMTREIMSILDEYGVTATFFVIGQNAVNYPETMKLLSESGYEIGNHTYSHKNLKNMSGEEIAAEFRRCRETLVENFSVEPTLIRPPEGFCSEALYSVSDDMDYDIILWSIDTRDWAHTPAEDIVKNVLGNARGGDIILMHDYIAGNSGTCDALRAIIPALQNRGFEFVTVSELIAGEA